MNGPDAKAQAAVKLAGLPVGFEPNRGQADSAVKYVARGGQYTLLLTSAGAVFALPKHLALPLTLKSITEQVAARRTTEPSSWTSVAMRFVGASPQPDFSESDRLPGVSNFFLGRDQSKWARAVPSYGRVREQNIYPGVDVVFRGGKQELEFDFLVNATADPGRIKLAFEGAEHSHLDPAGNLVLSSAAGSLIIRKPVAYQLKSDGSQQPVEVRFKKRRNGQIGFAIGSYDRRRQLTIDPSVAYATYLGGSAQDQGMGVAIDSAGNTFITGATNSPNFPNTGGGVTYQGVLDAFVVEFNSSEQLVFSTLVGSDIDYGDGSGDTVGTAIAVSESGQNTGIAVTGYTSAPNFPVNYTDGSYQYNLAGTQNAFVFVLGYGFENGLLEYGTYLGGEAVDAGLAITTDNDYGYIYVAGQTTSQQFPIMNPLSNDTQLNMGNGSGASDAFVAKMEPFLQGVWFVTFLGGANEDFASGIALDNLGTESNNIYVTGGTRSGGSTSPPSFYTTPGVLQPTCGTDGNCNGGQDDAFVTVLCTYHEAPCNATNLNVEYVYSTFLGGTGKDDGYAIAADLSDNAYLTGLTTSTDFKLQGPFQRTLNGAQNAFVSKLNPSGSALVFSTYLGGSQSDTGLGLAVDQYFNVYVTGRTSSPDFPLQSPTQGTIGGGNDAFISALTPAGNALTFSTFLGGSGDEDVLGGAIAVDATQNIYVTGDTNSTNFPTLNPYQASIGSTQNCTINGNQVLCPDAFVAKLNVPLANYSILTVTINGGPDGADGSVTSNPGGIEQCSDNPNAPGICTAEFPNGTLVTLTATPVESQFAGWSGDAPPSCGTNLTCQIQITANANVTASFVPVVGQIYMLAVSGVGINGEAGTGLITSSPAGINCGDGQQVCTFDFASGTQVTLTATPDPGSFFDGWSQTPINPACSGTGQCVVVMTSNQTVNYTFLLNNAPPSQPDFTLTVNPLSLGTIAIGSQGVAGISIGTLNGFTDTVNLSCSVQPASASAPSCSITPSTLPIPLNGAGSATLAVNTTGLTARRAHRTSSMLALCIPFLGAFVGVRIKTQSSSFLRNWWRLLLLGCLLTLLCFALACGSGGNAGGGGVAKAGDYTVVISGQGTTTLVTHSVQVTLTVQ